jgi:dephospho-CoA kinase
VRKIAIAGGIGSGKSAATSYLEGKGFVVADADIVARRVVEAGKPAWQALIDAFGKAVLTEQGEIDRQFVANVVFQDKSALQRLNLITHSAIGVELSRIIREATSPAVFVALPLFRTEHRTIFELDEAWAIEVEPDVAVERLVKYRSMSEEDARARLASQITNLERSSIVDVVVSNNGTLDQLYAKLDEQLKISGLQ